MMRKTNLINNKTKILFKKKMKKNSEVRLMLNHMQGITEINHCDYNY